MYQGEVTGMRVLCTWLKAGSNQAGRHNQHFMALWSTFNNYCEFLGEGTIFWPPV